VTTRRAAPEAALLVRFRYSGARRGGPISRRVAASRVPSARNSLPRGWFGLIGLAAAVVAVLGPSAPAPAPITHTPAGRVAPSTDADTALGDARDVVRDLLDRRAAAWRSSDAQAWHTTLAERGAVAQTAMFEALRRLRLDAWSEELGVLEPGPAGSWRASVVVRYRFAGDETDATVRGVLDITPQLRVAAATSDPVPPWEIDDVRSMAGQRSLVVGGAAADVLRRYSTELDQASRSVGSLLHITPPRVVLVLADDWGQAQRMRSGTEGDGLAALTTSLEPPGLPAGPVRVLADPSVLARLDAPTRVALLGHETFHVATRELGPVPLWLSEGLADYAGYRDSGVSLDRALAGLVGQSRVDGVPTALPDDAAFTDPDRATGAYEGAHLALRMLADEYGEEQVVELYRQAARHGAANLDDALRDVLGTDLAAVTSQWRTEVGELADD